MKTLHDIPREYVMPEKLMKGFMYLRNLGYTLFKKRPQSDFWDLWLPGRFGEDQFRGEPGRWVTMVEVEPFAAHYEDRKDDIMMPPFSPEWIVEE